MTTLTTTVRMIRPSTSSATAAPSTIARLDRRQGTEVAEDAGGDADARRGQGGAEEDRRLGVQAEADAGPGPDDERHGDADDGDQHRRPPDPTELGEVHLHADLHEQQQDAELGEHAEADAAVAAELDEAEHRRPDEDAGDDLAEHGGDADALGDLGRQLGGGDDDQQVEQQPRQVDGLDSRRARLPEARDDGQGQRHGFRAQPPPPTADGDDGVSAREPGGWPPVRSRSFAG